MLDKETPKPYNRAEFSLWRDVVLALLKNPNVSDMLGGRSVDVFADLIVTAAKARSSGFSTSNTLEDTITDEEAEQLFR